MVGPFWLLPPQVLRRYFRMAKGLVALFPLLLQVLLLH
jgi:hypothetical protein